MLEEASIQVHYEQGTKAPLRQKRFISKGLDSIDWNTSFVSDIPFNERDSMVIYLFICIYLFSQTTFWIVRKYSRTSMARTPREP